MRSLLNPLSVGLALTTVLILVVNSLPVHEHLSKDGVRSAPFGERRKRNWGTGVEMNSHGDGNGARWKRQEEEAQAMSQGQGQGQPNPRMGDRTAVDHHDNFPSPNFQKREQERQQQQQPGGESSDSGLSVPSVVQSLLGGGGGSSDSGSSVPPVVQSLLAASTNAASSAASAATSAVQSAVGALTNPASAGSPTAAVRSAVEKLASPVSSIAQSAPPSGNSQPQRNSGGSGSGLVNIQPNQLQLPSYLFSGKGDSGSGGSGSGPSSYSGSGPSSYSRGGYGPSSYFGQGGPSYPSGPSGPYHDSHPPPRLANPDEPERTALDAVNNFLPMVPTMMESVSGSLGHIFLESLPQAPVFNNLNNMLQVLVSPLSSVTTGMIGNTVEGIDDIAPGIHSLKPITDTFPGFTNLFNQAITHPQSFLLNPDTLSVPPLGTNGYNGGGGRPNLIPVTIPNPNGGGQSVIWVSPNGPGGYGNGYGHGGFDDRYPYHMPTSDINVEQIMGEGMQRILGLGAFMGNCPLGTIRLQTGGCQSIINAG